uniref:Putative secreted protein n=1 Tax=Amblyomma cajennense TaxID=34607 RepID=A0A023FTS2_AMBCJ
MFLVFAVAAGVFFSMGLGVPTPKTQDGVCQDPKTVVRAGNRNLTVPRITENCTCTLKDGKQANYPNGTSCFGKDDRRSQIGKCYNGACTLAPSTFGCAGKNGTEQDSTIKDDLCFFECTSKDGKKEWAFLPDGFPCVNRDDGEDHPKNGTCKHRPHRDSVEQKETVCFPNDKLYLVGC